MNHVNGMLLALDSWFNGISSAIFHAYHQQHKHQAQPKKKLHHSLKVKQTKQWMHNSSHKFRVLKKYHIYYIWNAWKCNVVSFFQCVHPHVHHTIRAQGKASFSTFFYLLGNLNFALNVGFCGALRALQFLCSPVMFSVYYNLTIKSQHNVIFWLRRGKTIQYCCPGAI